MKNVPLIITHPQIQDLDESVFSIRGARKAKFQNRLGTRVSRERHPDAKFKEVLALNLTMWSQSPHHIGLALKKFIL